MNKTIKRISVLFMMLLMACVLGSCTPKPGTDTTQSSSTQGDIEAKGAKIGEDATSTETGQEISTTAGESEDVIGADVPKDFALEDFVGDYRGVNPFYVVDWTTYTMSEEVDRSTLSVEKTGDDLVLTDIILDSDQPSRHMTLNPIFLHEEDMIYYEDTDTQEEGMWDNYELELEDMDIIFSKWRKNGQLMITIDFGDGSPQMYVSK